VATRSAAEILAALEPLGIRLDLDVFRALLDALGSPERGLAPILVAGTNGKGSVAAMLDAIGREAGLSTGLYTSPHLERWTERIRIGGREIGDERLAATLERVLAAAAARDLPAPTPFEALTAAALLELAESDVELAVLEVGLGGRLDATNAVEPALSVITRVALDHGELLGADLTSIAREKAGILRAGTAAVVGAQEPAAAAALAAEAGAAGAVLHEIDREVAIGDVDWRGFDGLDLHLRTPVRSYRLQTPLAGEHQAANVAIAVRAAELAARRWPQIDAPAIERGIATCRWPGRLERLGRMDGVEIIVDAAHNPDGCAALGRFLDRLGRRFVLLFGALADKRVEEMLPPLAERAVAVVLTRPSTPRAREPRELLALVPDALIGREIDAALDLAIRRAQALRSDLVVACGSIYLVGDVRTKAQ
jgi:dihydrofolate synthase/folylpolyglutamate synthase